MFLLPSVIVGLLLGLALGGKPARLLEVKFRLAWTVPVALVVQVVLFSSLGAHVPGPLARPLHLATYALLLAFVAANLRIRALVPALAGVALNAIAIAANGGVMPVSTGAARAAGIDAGSSNVSEAADRLGFLGDAFAIPSGFPLANTFSVGDVLIGVGTAAFIVIVSLRGAATVPGHPEHEHAAAAAAARH
jgi:hypothetical protein